MRVADEKVNKASKAAKFVKKGSKGKLLKKRFSATFHRYVLRAMVDDSIRGIASVFVDA